MLDGICGKYRPGFEPGTDELKAHYSTIELPKYPHDIASTTCGNIWLFIQVLVCLGTGIHKTSKHHQQRV